MKQLVISGNKVVTYGEDCFFAFSNGFVACINTGEVFANATIANAQDVPEDINEVGYEYHAGEFVPCAPFGVGDGNIAVVCGDDCKAIKDSGKSMQHLGRVAEITYTGTGSSGSYYPNSVTVDFTPQFAIVTRSDEPSESSANFAYRDAVVAILSKQGGIAYVPAYYFTDASVPEYSANIVPLKTTFSDNSIEWWSGAVKNGTSKTGNQTIFADRLAQCNVKDYVYTITVFGN